MVRAPARVRSRHTVPAPAREYRLAGHVAGFFAFIPFGIWVHVHRPPPQVDRMAGSRSDHGRPSRLSHAARFERSHREHLLEVLDSALLDRVSPRQLLEPVSTACGSIRLVESDGASSAGLVRGRGVCMRPSCGGSARSSCPHRRRRHAPRLRRRRRAHHQPAHARPDGAERRTYASRPTGRSTRNDSRGRCDFHRCCRGWRSISMPTNCITCTRSCPGIDCARSHTSPPTKSAGGAGSGQPGRFPAKRCSSRTGMRQGSTCDVDGARSARLRRVPRRGLRAGRAARRRCGLASPTSRRLAMPVDGGRTFRDRRLLGDNKTLRGFVVMVPATGLAFLLRVTASRSRTVPGLWPLTPLEYGGLGVLAGAGFMAGELPNSFLKRQLGIPPGAPADRRQSRAVSFSSSIDSIRRWRACRVGAGGARAARHCRLRVDCRVGRPRRRSAC